MSSTDAELICSVELMTSEDLPFVFGLFIGPLIAISVFTGVIATARSRRLIAVVSALAAVWVLSFVTFWVAWGMGFDEVDAGREPSGGPDLAMSVAIGASAISAALLLVTGVALMISSISRRKPSMRAA